MGVSRVTFLALVAFLALIPPTTPSCMRGSPRECKDAEFAPGSNLAGEGFDITKMQRKGSFVIDMNLWRRKNSTCLLCKNPYQENKMQKVPVAVVDWRTSQQCSMKVVSSQHQSSESLVTSSTSTVQNDWKANLEINVHASKASLILAGSKSKLAEYSMGKTKKDKYTFLSHKTVCKYYSYGVSGAPPLHEDFLRAIGRLPKKYTTESKQRFYKLIDVFGTHYMTKVTLGGMVQSVTSVRQCLASLHGLNSDEIQKCLSLEAEASVTGAVHGGVNMKYCKEQKSKIEDKNSFSSNFNDRLTEIFGGHTTEPELLFSADRDPAAYKEWLSSLPMNPEVVSYSLDPLYQLLNNNLPVREELRKATSHYILERGLWHNCSEPCGSGIKRNSQEPCKCTCHGNPGVNVDCCPTQRGFARVVITVVRATGLWGDSTTSTDGYVKVFNSKNMQLGRTRVIWNNDSPVWNAVFDIGNVVLTSTGMVKFEVWDEDNKWDDDLLGSCTVDLKEGTKEDVCQLDHGLFYYKLQVSCGPSLSGPSCSDYVNSPMNSHLEGLYLSRHARPIPKEMLQKMGVFLDQDGHFNETDPN